MSSSQRRAELPGGRPRAQRYEIDAAIHFRAIGEKIWNQGFIRNISISGILIQTDRIYPLGTPLKMRFVLPVDLNGKAPAEVYCRAVVIRSSPTQQTPGSGFLAATIDQSRLVRPAS